MFIFTCQSAPAPIRGFRTLPVPPKVDLCMCAQSLQSCPTPCYPMDYNTPGSAVHGILQAIILECVVMPSSKGSS